MPSCIKKRGIKKNIQTVLCVYAMRTIFNLLHAISIFTGATPFYSVHFPCFVIATISYTEVRKIAIAIISNYDMRSDKNWRNFKIRGESASRSRGRKRITVGIISGGLYSNKISNKIQIIEVIGLSMCLI